MKTRSKILIAFILNLSFSIFEFIGGALTGSVAIASDAIHDLGDAASIGLSYFFERKSEHTPDKTYTYGYTRYSVLGSLITTLILLIGSTIVIYNAVLRFFNPVEIHYNGMVIFAVIGVVVNLIAAFFTSGGHSLNQRAVNLHMLEDVLGWIIVLIGAVIMKFTRITVMDSILSIGVALFILINVFKNLKEIVDLFLEKIPSGISLENIEKHISEIDGIVDVHHIHIRSFDGESNCATMHIVYNGNPFDIKEKIREALKSFNIVHSTLELEAQGEPCGDERCSIKEKMNTHSHHHHHH